MDSIPSMKCEDTDDRRTNQMCLPNAGVAPPESSSVGGVIVGPAPRRAL